MKLMFEARQGIFSLTTFHENDFKERSKTSVSEKRKTKTKQKTEGSLPEPCAWASSYIHSDAVFLRAILDDELIVTRIGIANLTQLVNSSHLFPAVKDPKGQPSTQNTNTKPVVVQYHISYWYWLGREESVLTLPEACWRASPPCCWATNQKWPSDVSSGWRQTQSRVWDENMQGLFSLWKREVYYQAKCTYQDNVKVIKYY